MENLAEYIKPRDNHSIYWQGSKTYELFDNNDRPTAKLPGKIRDMSARIKQMRIEGAKNALEKIERIKRAKANKAPKALVSKYEALVMEREADFKARCLNYEGDAINSVNLQIYMDYKAEVANRPVIRELCTNRTMGIIYGVSESTINKYAAKGRIDCVWIGLKRYYFLPDIKERRQKQIRELVKDYTGESELIEMGYKKSEINSVNGLKTLDAMVIDGKIIYRKVPKI